MLTYFVYAPLFLQLDGLEAYLNLLRLDMSSRYAGLSDKTYRFKSQFKYRKMLTYF